MTCNTSPNYSSIVLLHSKPHISIIKPVHHIDDSKFRKRQSACGTRMTLVAVQQTGHWDLGCSNLHSTLRACGAVPTAPSLSHNVNVLSNICAPSPTKAQPEQAVPVMGHPPKVGEPWHLARGVDYRCTTTHCQQRDSTASVLKSSLISTGQCCLLLKTYSTSPRPLGINFRRAT